ncbi:uncharacterized protein LOC143038961 isoform X2 [Oratosquilla oratoria]|uniref:uncharacterized protein LOC143038961 isoform X2 n=1 Tax=Oratosquilla oratoria TaxID=337810 RepID=UPI003F7733B0
MKGIRMCCSRSTVMGTVGGVLLLLGLTQIVSGVYFLMTLPIFSIGSNIWTGAWTCAVGLLLTGTAYMNYVTTKGKVLLVALVSSLALNVANMVIVQIGEKDVFLDKDDLSIIISTNKDIAFRVAIWLTTGVTAAAIIVSFVGAQYLFCVLIRGPRVKGVMPVTRSLSEEDLHDRQELSDGGPTLDDVVALPDPSSSSAWVYRPEEDKNSPLYPLGLDLLPPHYPPHATARRIPARHASFATPRYAKVHQRPQRAQSFAVRRDMFHRPELAQVHQQFSAGKIVPNANPVTCPEVPRSCSTIGGRSSAKRRLHRSNSLSERLFLSGGGLESGTEAPGGSTLSRKFHACSLDDLDAMPIIEIGSLGGGSERSKSEHSLDAILQDSSSSSQQQQSAAKGVEVQLHREADIQGKLLDGKKVLTSFGPIRHMRVVKPKGPAPAPPTASSSRKSQAPVVPPTHDTTPFSSSTESEVTFTTSSITASAGLNIVPSSSFSTINDLAKPSSTEDEVDSSATMHKNITLEEREKEEEGEEEQEEQEEEQCLSSESNMSSADPETTTSSSPSSCVAIGNDTELRSNREGLAAKLPDKLPGDRHLPLPVIEENVKNTRKRPAPQPHTIAPEDARLPDVVVKPPRKDIVKPPRTGSALSGLRLNDSRSATLDNRRPAKPERKRLEKLEQALTDILDQGSSANGSNSSCSSSNSSTVTPVIYPLRITRSDENIAESLEALDSAKKPKSILKNIAKSSSYEEAHREALKDSGPLLERLPSNEVMRNKIVLRVPSFRTAGCQTESFRPVRRRASCAQTNLSVAPKLRDASGPSKNTKASKATKTSKVSKTSICTTPTTLTTTTDAGSAAAAAPPTSTSTTSMTSSSSQAATERWRATHPDPNQQGTLVESSSSSSGYSSPDVGSKDPSPSHSGPPSPASSSISGSDEDEKIAPRTEGNVTVIEINKEPPPSESSSSRLPVWTQQDRVPPPRPPKPLRLRHVSDASTLVAPGTGGGRSGLLVPVHRRQTLPIPLYEDIFGLAALTENVMLLTEAINPVLVHAAQQQGILKEAPLPKTKPRVVEVIRKEPSSRVPHPHPPDYNPDEATFSQRLSRAEMFAREGRNPYVTRTLRPALRSHSLSVPRHLSPAGARPMEWSRSPSPPMMRRQNPHFLSEDLVAARPQSAILSDEIHPFPRAQIISSQRQVTPHQQHQWGAARRSSSANEQSAAAYLASLELLASHYRQQALANAKQIQMQQLLEQQQKQSQREPSPKSRTTSVAEVGTSTADIQLLQPEQKPESSHIHGLQPPQEQSVKSESGESDC